MDDNQAQEKTIEVSSSSVKSITIRMRTLLGILMIFLLVGMIAGRVVRVHPAFDLLNHFQLQYAIVSIIALLIFLVLRCWRWSLIAAVCVALSTLQVIPWYRAPTPHLHEAEPGDAASLRILVANVLTSNRDCDRLLSLVREEEPDVLILQEINDWWASSIVSLSGDLPYSVVEPEEHNFGMGLYSKYPLHSTILHTMGPYELITIECAINFHDRDIVIIAAHPPPPIRPPAAIARDVQLEELGDLVRGHNASNVIVCGDLNCTMWSGAYRDLIETTGLQNSRNGFGILPSWPTFLPSVMRIPVDHCLHSTDARVLDCRLGSAIGSDHLPLIVDFQFSAK